MAPLSFAQQRVWFVHQLLGPNTIFNLPVLFKIQGPLDETALSVALVDVVDRHESLRTLFSEANGTGVQTVLKGGAAQLVLDTRTIEEAALPDEASYAGAYLFDLSRDIPVRTTLFRIGEQRYALLLLLHHIASDGWSLGPLMRDLGTAYGARVRGKLPAWEPLPVQYIDYTIWQQELANQESDPEADIARQIAFWKDNLAGLPEQLRLPTDRPRPFSSTQRGARVRFSLDMGVQQRLRNLARENGATLFMVLHAGLATLLTRYGAGEDLPIGTSVAGRSDEALNDLVGLFVNLLVLRTNTSGNPTFNELLRRVRNVDLAAFSHQDVPFERVVDIVNPRRTASQHPLFQVALILDNNPATIELDGLATTWQHLASETAQYDLSFSFQSASYLTCELEYASDLFETATAQRLAEHFRSLMEAISERPDTPISQLALLSDDERHLILGTWNDTAQPVPNGTLPELFARQIQRSPDAIAAIAGEQTLSYRELDERSNQLAHHLIGLGVGTDTLVGLCIERSFELLIGTLGIVKAGAAYLPLDPSYPAERLMYMLDEAVTPVVVTQSMLSERLPSHWSTLVLLDTDAPEIASLPTSAPVTRLHPDQLAYVMYTSGSTGTPKGIAVTHRNVCELAWDRRWRDGSHERVLMHSPQVFDASTYEIWVPLLSGHQIVIAPPGRNLLVADVIEQQRVTAVFLTTALFRLLADERPQCLAHVRTVWSGGEAASTQAFKTVLDHCPDTDVVHVYGPTETTTFVTCHSMRAPLQLSGTIPIGSPMDNTQAYVLDTALQPVPVGVVGDLYIGGGGLARGYLGRRALTAERFVANPYGEPGSRMYRTGDLARWLREGTIEFVGRADHQVKINGFRVEPGEIETALCEQSCVRHAAVVVREDAPGRKQLVGYIVSATGEKVDLAALRRSLSARLPDYMVPAAIIALDALPLTTSGKLDARALPPPDFNPTEHQAPRTPLEQTLAELFMEALGLDRVGVHDSFFDLGGDSILAIKLKARAQKAGLGFELADLFDHQSVAALAAVAAPAGVDTAPLSTPFNLTAETDRQQIPSDIEDAYPLSHLQAGMLFHSQYERESTLYHMVFCATQQLPCNAQAIRAVLDELSARHEMLRTCFDFSRYSEPLQLVQRHAEIPLVIHDLRQQNDLQRTETYQRWRKEEMRHQFDLSVAPLLRVFVHRLHDELFHLSLSFNHAIMDGWSDATLVAEFVERYQGKLEGRDMAPPPLKTRYRDYIALERAALGSETSSAFWANAIGGLEATDPRPIHPPQTGVEAAADADELEQHVPIAVDAETLAGLRKFAASTQAPLKSVLLAAHMAALSALTGNLDVVTALVTNGRPETADADKLVGLFLNSLPFRLRLDNGDWRGLVGQVMNAERDLLPHRHYPMHRIMAENGLQGGLKVLFNYTHFHVYEQLGELGRQLRVDGGAGDISFPLQINFQRYGDDISATVTGHRRVYDRRTLEHYAACYANVLQTMAQNPDQTVRLPELAGTSRSLSRPANRDSAVYCLHRRFEALCEKAPERRALIDNDRSLSYGELNAWANSIAATLLAQGICRGDFIGLVVCRGAAQIAAILGILKCGAAYVPVTPDTPAERMQTIFFLTKVRLIVHDATATEHMLTFERTLLLPDRRADAKHFANPHVEVSVFDPIYVIHTSGTTGTPKGVVASHFHVSRMFTTSENILDLRAEDVWSLFHSFAFDFGVWELWGALAYGGTLVLIDEETSRSTDRFLECLHRYKVTVLNQTPSAFRQLVAQAARRPEIDLWSGIRLILLDGEPLDYAGLRGWYDQKGTEHCRLVHTYGITETTIHATYRFVQPEDAVDNQPNRCGEPFPDLSLYILDDRLQPVPVGQVGSIYIGGLGLAYGYHAAADTTATRFIADPFSHTAGDRMYFTGDLGRFLPDSDLEVLGRRDDQVKIRGFRVTLGEIESALTARLNANKVVAFTLKDASGTDVLAACVAIREGTHRPEVAEVRAQLKTILPSHMVPAQIAFVSSLPLTRNGKVDRQAAKRLLERTEQHDRQTASSGTASERSLATIWSRLLRLGSAIYPDDDFFALGGHSLLMVELATRIEAELGVRAQIGMLYKDSTLRQQAAMIDTLAPESSSHGFIEYYGERDATGAAFVHAIGGDVFSYSHLIAAASEFAGVATIAHPDMTLDRPPRARTLVELATIYRRALAQSSRPMPRVLVGWSFGGWVAQEIARQSEQEGSPATLVIMIDSPLAHDAGFEVIRSLIGTSQGAHGALQAQAERLAGLERFREMLDADYGLHASRVPLDDKSFENLVRLYAANFAALVDHSPYPIATPLTYVAATEGRGRHVDRTHLRAFTKGEISLIRLPATHSSILQNDCGRQIVRLIEEVTVADTIR